MLRDTWFEPIKGDDEDRVLDALRKKCDGITDEQLHWINHCEFVRLPMPFYKQADGQRVDLVRIRFKSTDGWNKEQLDKQNESNDAKADDKPTETWFETYLLLPEGKPEAAALLNTTSLPIHAFNREYLSFDEALAGPREVIVPDAPWAEPRKENSAVIDLDPVDLYTRFFCQMVWGEEGPFLIANDKEDLKPPAAAPDPDKEGAHKVYRPKNSEESYLDDNAQPDRQLKAPQEISSELHESIRESLQSTKVQDENDGRQGRPWLAQRVLYGNALFDGAFAANTHDQEKEPLTDGVETTIDGASAEAGTPVAKSAGYVEMLDDEPIRLVPHPAVGFRKVELFHPKLTWHVRCDQRALTAWADTLSDRFKDLGSKDYLDRLAKRKGNEITPAQFIDQVRRHGIVKDKIVTGDVVLRGTGGPVPASSKTDTQTIDTQQDQDTFRDHVNDSGDCTCREGARKDCETTLVSQCAVQWENVEFTGFVDIEHTNFASSLIIKNCVFKGWMNFSYVSVGKTLQFINPDLRYARAITLNFVRVIGSALIYRAKASSLKLYQFEARSLDIRDCVTHQNTEIYYVNIAESIWNQNCAAAKCIIHRLDAKYIHIDRVQANALSLYDMQGKSLSITECKTHDNIDLSLTKILSFSIIEKCTANRIKINGLSASHVAMRAVETRGHCQFKHCTAQSFEIGDVGEKTRGEGKISCIAGDLSLTQIAVEQNLDISNIVVKQYTELIAVTANTMKFGAPEVRLSDGSVSRTNLGKLSSGKTQHTEEFTQKATNDPRDDDNASTKQDLPGTGKPEDDTGNNNRATESGGKLTFLGERVTAVFGCGLTLQSCKSRSSVDVFGAKIGLLAKASEEVSELAHANTRAHKGMILFDNCTIGRSLNLYGRSAAVNKLVIDTRSDKDSEDAGSATALMDLHDQPLWVLGGIDINNTSIGSELDIRDVVIAALYTEDSNSTDQSDPQGQGKTSDQQRQDFLQYIRIRGVEVGSHIRMEPVKWNFSPEPEEDNKVDKGWVGRNGYVCTTVVSTVLLNAVRCGGDLRISGLEAYADDRGLRSIKDNKGDGKPYPAVRLRNTHVDGDLEFYSPAPSDEEVTDAAPHSKLKASGPVELESCRVEGRIDARRVQIVRGKLKGNESAPLLSMKDVYARGGLLLNGDEDLYGHENAKVEGAVELQRLRVDGDVDLSCLEVKQDLMLSQCEVAGEFRLCSDLVDGQPKLKFFALVRGLLLVTDCTIGTVLLYEGCLSDREAVLTKCPLKAKKCPKKQDDREYYPFNTHSFSDTTADVIRFFALVPQGQKEEMCESWNTLGRVTDLRGFSAKRFGFYQPIVKSHGENKDSDNCLIMDTEKVRNQSGVSVKPMAKFLFLSWSMGQVQDPQAEDDKENAKRDQFGIQRNPPRPRDLFIVVERLLIDQWRTERAEGVRRWMLEEAVLDRALRHNEKTLGWLESNDSRTMKFVKTLYTYTPALSLLLMPVFTLFKLIIRRFKPGLFPKPGPLAVRARSMRMRALSWFGYGSMFRYAIWLVLLWLFSGLIVLGSEENIRPSIQSVESNRADLVDQVDKGNVPVKNGTTGPRDSVVNPWKPPNEWNEWKGTLLASHYVLPMLELPVKEEWRPAPPGSQDQSDDAASDSSAEGKTWAYGVFGVPVLRISISPETVMFFVSICAWITWPMLLLSVAGVIRRANLRA